MENFKRFSVTKCNDDYLYNGVNDSNSSNMNTIDLVNSKRNDIKALKNGVSFKESSKNKRRNSNLAYTNAMFTLEESESEYSTVNLDTPQQTQSSRVNFDSNKLDYRNELQVESKPNTWDSFGTPNSEEADDSMSSDWVNYLIRLSKVVIYLLTFTLNLICGIVSNSLLLLMTSMIRDDHKVDLCRKDFDILIPGRTYVANYGKNSPERIGWIWCLFTAMIAPQVLSLYKCIKYCLFKNHEKPKLRTFLTVFSFESMNTIGLVLLVVMVLPNIDSSRGPMLSHSISLFPAIVVFISRLFKDNNQRKITLLSFDMISLLLQLICPIGWALIVWKDPNSNIEKNEIWVIPFVMIFISMGYWDNYLTLKDWKFRNSFVKYLCEVKKDLNKSRYYTYALISIWKIILTFITILLYFEITDSTKGNSVAKYMFLHFDDAFSRHPINVSRATIESIKEEMPVIYSTPSIYLWILSLQILSTLLCYVITKFVCKIQIQVFSFAFCLTLVSPMTIVLINILSRLRLKYMCEVTQVLSLKYIFWRSDIHLNEEEIHLIDHLESVLWILSLFSQLWITSHIWEPKSERMAKTENLFSKPEFNCVFIDQSLVLNRRIDSEKIQIRKMSREEREMSRNETVRIYMCATMWHENVDEMIQMLKSIFRMDIDQSARRQAKQYLSVTLDDYYECETHIFFDDAFEDNKFDDKTNRVVNHFVKDFTEVIESAAGAVHECIVCLEPPTITVTPYGGRLVWILPGQNRLYVHLKDKNQIRHKKRWSQVMYMYYLLGYRLKDEEQSIRDKIAENTFILALDGDINFQPKAVKLLIDLMIKHKNLGAACGRIHPIGSGPLVWYQKFEYAIGHWLQKATEHVIGCVLCSPGCFSLFRAKALMSENVMSKYTSKASEAAQYVQFDQGEDRWLCTLLLQQGWRIEYCAASDSFTHAPEGFGEFYNQRRRWAPSTLFNIWELLVEFRRTVQINDNISTLYIIYQFALLLGTVLSPGCIFLMIVGAMSTSFNLSSSLCIIYSGFPILIFIIICFFFKDELQIRFAIILSIIYALLMLAVMVSTVMEMVTEGFYQPTSVFFLSICLSFLIAALIHPTEFLCVLPLPLYMLCIPSMYLLLTIYSIINLNVISWGTREGHPVSQQNQNQLKAEVLNKNEFLKNFQNYFKRNQSSKLISCVCCSQSPPEEDNEVLKEITELKTQLKDFKTVLKSSEPKFISDLSPIISETNSPFNRFDHSFNSTQLTDIEENEEEFNKLHAISRPRNQSFGDNISQIYDNIGDDSPFWTKDKCFDKFISNDLTEEETTFWKQFIEKYLLPLDRDPHHEERVRFDLKELRDKIAAAFGLLNSLFILLVLLLQLHPKITKFNWPITFCHIKAQDDDVQDEQSVQECNTVNVNFDAIGISLIIFFGVILLIQLLGMLWHRFNTFSLLLSVTEIKLFSDPKEVANTQEVLTENAVKIAKQLQRVNSNELAKGHKSLRSKRPELQPINSVPIHSEVTNLDHIFLKRVKSMKNDFDNEQVLPESKLTRNGRNRTITGRDVRKEIYKKVQRSVKRKQIVSNQF